MGTIAGIWLLGTLYNLIKLLYGIIYVKGFSYGLEQVDLPLTESQQVYLKKVFKHKANSSIYVSDKVVSPLIIGVIDPIIILPKQSYETLTFDKIYSILLHELGHIKHRDHILGIIQHIIVALNWWNPVVWKLSFQLSNAREEVCENYAINAMKNPKHYASCLVNLAEKTCELNKYAFSYGMASKRLLFN